MIIYRSIFHIILTEGLPPPKPKKGSKSQPTKKVIPPLLLDSLGRPVFPLNIGDLTIHSIGEVNLSLVLLYTVTYICSTLMLVFVSSFSAVNIHSNRIGGAMLSLLASSAIDHWFKPWSGHSKDY